jgi:hypothetical protein
MAYEEVGMPTFFCGKKKYFMTPHIDTINFYPEDIFIRGVEIIKQGQTQIAKQLGMEYMKEVLSPANEIDPYELALDKIKKFFNMCKTSSIRMFIKSAKYKPDKKNVPVLKFIERMKFLRDRYKNDPVKAALYDIPAPGDKFPYVVVARKTEFNLRGNRIELKKGDKMEFVRTYIASQSTPEPLELDINYYADKALSGTFSRFICYHDDFQPTDHQYDLTDKDQYQKFDKECVHNASKIIMQMCNEESGHNPKQITTTSAVYRKKYRDISKQLQQHAAEKYGPALEIVTHLPTDVSHTEAFKAIMTRSKDVPMSANGDKFITAMGDASPFILHRLYSQNFAPNIITQRLQYITTASSTAETELFRLIPNMWTQIRDTHKRLEVIINDSRDHDSTITMDDIELINCDLPDLDKMFELYQRIKVLARMRADILSISRAVAIKRAEAINSPEPAAIITPKIYARADAVASKEIPEYQFA